MKTLAFVFTLFTFTLFAQDNGKDNYVEIPALTKEIKINGKAIPIEKAIFKYLPEYDYVDGIVFGSWIKVVITGIEPVNSFKGFGYNLVKGTLTNTDKSIDVFSEDWGFGEGVELDSDDTKLRLTDRIKIGDPYYSGNYIWKIELAEMCSDKTVTIELKFKIIPNPCIKVETSGTAKVEEVYLWNKEEKFIYANDQIYTGQLECTHADISGFTIKEGLAKVGVELKLTDEKGNALEYAEDVAKDENAFFKTENGIVTITPNVKIRTAQIDQTLTFTSRIWDKHNPKNEVKSVAVFKVIK